MSELLVQLTIIGGYLVVALGIGLIAYRISRYTAEDFYLAGRTIGTLVLLFTIFATLLSAFTFFGGPNIAFHQGPEWILVMGVMDGILFALLWYFIGYKQWLLGKQHGYVTVGELLGDRFGSTSLRVLVALISLFWLFPYVMLQQMGAGTALEALTEGSLPYFAGSGLITLFMIAYVVLAGMRGIAWTDTLQGLFMFVVTWVACVWIVNETGGLASLGRSLSERAPEFINLGGGLYSAPFVISTAVSIAFGVALFPQINQRFFVAKSKQVLKRSFYLWPVFVILLFVPAFMLGSWAKGLGLSVEKGGNVLPVLLEQFTPFWFSALVIAGAMAAMMSSSDSMLLSGASYFTRDIYRPLIDPEISDRRENVLSRIVVVLIALGAYGASLAQPGTLIQVGKTAFGGFAQLTLPLILALFWAQTNAYGLLCGILGSQIYYLISVFTSWLPDTVVGWDASILGMILGSAITVLVSLLVAPGTGPRQHRP